MNRNLVFLPGWGLGRGVWQPTADALGGEIIDLPGYGSAPPLTDFHGAAAAIAGRLAPGAILCGWSLGAMLALAVAASHPDKVSRLVLIAGTASFVQRDGWNPAMAPAVLEQFAAAVAADPAAALVRFVGGFNQGDSRRKAVTRELLERAEIHPAAATLASGLAWLRDVDLRTVATGIATPTLILHGAADPLMPLPAAQALAALIPGSRLEVLADCAHAPFISAPEAFRASLTAFCHVPPV